MLPAATLTFALIAHVSRMTRSSMLETLRSPYVLLRARQGRCRERVVLLRHALRNALLPTITVLAIDVGLLIGGIVVVETVFSYPGLGRLLMFAIERHDLPLIQASILVDRRDLLLRQSRRRSALRVLQPEDPLWPRSRLTRGAAGAAAVARARACRATLVCGRRDHPGVHRRAGHRRAVDRAVSVRRDAASWRG